MSDEREDFPYNPRSKSVASFAVWKRVAEVDLKRLKTEPRNAALWTSLSPEAKEKVQAALDRRNPEKAGKETPAANSPKEKILARVDQAISEAEDDGDLTAKLRGLELVARIEKLLATQPTQDRETTINVITGVPR
jgi:hypothetical protein